MMLYFTFYSILLQGSYTGLSFGEMCPCRLRGLKGHVSAAPKKTASQTL